jgi:hypothetical protein
MDECMDILVNIVSPSCYYIYVRDEPEGQKDGRRSQAAKGMEGRKMDGWPDKGLVNNVL